jgi:hypothetical protein
MGEYPLWPKSYGGDTWETGSGALKHVAAGWPKSVYRTKEHLTYLKNAGIYENVLQFQLVE